VLVCGLGKGGKGYFALDVTDPTTMDATDVLWEYSAAAASDLDLGYTFGRAFIIKTQAYGMVVIFSNGYDSANGSAVLYVVDPVTGAVIKKFDTGVAGCNGLATPAAVDVELDGYVDYVFAGDLKGNMWKFDLRGSSTGDWSFAYQDGAIPKPLVSVKNKNGDIQPITTPPEVMLDCASNGDVRGLMVIFGTGQYLNVGDFTNTPVQSFYGIWDRGPLIEDADGAAVARTKYLGTFDPAADSLSNMPSGITLLEQVFDVLTPGAEFGALSDRPADWYDETAGSGTHLGWYWDMPEAGERMVNDPLLRGGHVILVSTDPSSSPCESGGTSFINIVNACTGGRPYSPQFDVDKDHQITHTDTILGPTGNPIPPSRQEKPLTIFTPLEVGDMLYLPDSEGGHGSMPVVPIRSGMFFWRVIGQ
jgi:Tfp pilus tip-associated adhesin PilY1